MANVEYKPLKVPSRGGKSSVTSKRIRMSEGPAITVRTVRAESQTFGEDLRYVFEKNVTKARRENRELVGSSGRVRSKG